MKYLFSIVILFFGCKSFSYHIPNSSARSSGKDSKHVYGKELEIKRDSILLIGEILKYEFSLTNYLINLRPQQFGHYADTSLNERRRIFDKTLRRGKFIVFSKKKKNANKLLAHSQMIGMMNAMLMKPNKEGMDLLTYMMIKMGTQYSSKSTQYQFIAKWYEGSKYIFNAEQKKRIERAFKIN